MGLYDFKPRFVPPIKAGTKKHTIRSIRKYPDKVGNTIHCYCGLRRKGKKPLLIGRFECVNVENIFIEILGPIPALIRERDIAVSINGVPLSESEKEQLARADGFESFRDMTFFWTTPKNRLPFRGQIIHWK